MRKEKAKYVRYCLYCGKKFKAKRPKAKFCTDSHRAAYAQNNQSKNPDEARTELFNKIESLLETYKSIAPEHELAELGDELKQLLSDVLDDFIERKGTTDKKPQATKTDTQVKENIKEKTESAKNKKIPDNKEENMNTDDIYYFEPDPPPAPEN